MWSWYHLGHIYLGGSSQTYCIRISRRGGSRMCTNNSSINFDAFKITKQTNKKTQNPTALKSCDCEYVNRSQHQLHSLASNLGLQSLKSCLLCNLAMPALPRCEILWPAKSRSLSDTPFPGQFVLPFRQILAAEDWWLNSQPRQGRWQPVLPWKLFRWLYWETHQDAGGW